MNEEEFVKDFNRTIGKLEGFKLTEHKDLPNEADLFFRPVLEEEEIKGNLGKLSPKEKNMTTYEFEKIAKNAVIRIMKEKHGIDLTINELEFVWFAHELGFKKCTLYAKKLGHYYPEVTYNRDKDELYVDIYLKQSNTLVPASEFEVVAHV